MTLQALEQLVKKQAAEIAALTRRVEFLERENRRRKTEAQRNEQLIQRQN